MNKVLFGIYCKISINSELEVPRDLVEVELNYNLGLGISLRKSRGDPFLLWAERANFAA